MRSLSFFVNQKPVTLKLDPHIPLLDVLRDELKLTGTKQGCDREGECGTCTVLLDGRSVRACLTPVGKVADRHVSTIEGLSTSDQLHPLQAAFIETGAVQCGYCTPGMLMAAQGLLKRHPHPTHNQILDALDGNLCRCTGYKRIQEAVELAAAMLRGEGLASQPTCEVVGGDFRRYDAIDKVTGKAKFVEDISLPDMLYARMLRSPHHHARLLALNYEHAAQISGVVGILSAKDIPGENGFGEFGRNEPVLTPVGDTLRMIGAPIALVIGTSPEQAQHGVEAIEATFEVLPHSFDMDETLAPDAFPISGDRNVLTSFAVNHGDLDHAFEHSDAILKTKYQTAYLEHSALEREATLGYVDEKGRITVLGTTHEPHWNQGYIAATLALDPDQVRFISPPMGGSFGGKQDPTHVIAVALAVYHLRQPVRYVLSRRESFHASPKRHPYDVNYQIGATREGLLTGIHLRINANTGGYDAHGQYLADYAVTAGGGAYGWQSVDAYAQTVYTNGPKSGQFRGFGNSQATFALECTLDEMAERLDIDPLELRFKNAIDQKTNSFLGYPVGESLGYKEVLRAIKPHYQALLEEMHAVNTEATRSESRLRMGVGVAGMWYRFGKSGPLRVEAHAELAQDGHIKIYCSAPDYGQGTNTMLSQFAAEALQLPRGQIEVINGDTALVPDSGIQGASRSTYFVGGAVNVAAKNMRQTITAVAAEMLDCHPINIGISDGKIVQTDDPSRSLLLKEVGEEFDRIGLSRKLPGFFDIAAHFPEESRPEYLPLFTTAAQVAQVFVDLRTGVVEVKRIVAAQDVGKVINPQDAKGQLEGSVMIGLGAALMEEFIPGKCNGFGDYYIPTIKSVPEIETLIVEVPSFYGPLGVKGLAEASVPASTPAIVNAISRAIGVRIRAIPVTPERILMALLDNKGRAKTHVPTA